MAYILYFTLVLELFVTIGYFRLSTIDNFARFILCNL
jgi:hypothetical protein